MWPFILILALLVGNACPCTADSDIKLDMGVGTCTETPNSEGDCQRGHLGSFPASKLGRKVSLESCAERCLRCARCHYVSLSISHDDCSWFHTCRLPLQLTRGGATYRSAAVRTDGAAFEAIASSLAAASAAATAAANQPAAKLLAAMRRRDEREALIVLQSAPAAASEPVAGTPKKLLPLHLAIRELQAGDALVAALVDAYPAAAAVEAADDDALPLTLLVERVSPHAQSAAVVALLRAHTPAVQVLRSTPGALSYLPLHIALTTRADEGALLALIAAYPAAAARLGDVRGDLPLHLACEYNASAKVVHALIEAYPQAASTVLEAGVVHVHPRIHGGGGSGGGGNAGSTRGYLPLHLAARHRASLAVIRLLLDAHPPGAWRRGAHGELPLHLATEFIYGDIRSCLSAVEVVSELRRAYAGGVRTRDDAGNTPIDLATSPNDVTAATLAAADCVTGLVTALSDHMAEGRALSAGSLLSTDVAEGSEGRAPSDGADEGNLKHAALFVAAEKQAVYSTSLAHEGPIAEQVDGGARAHGASSPAAYPWPLASCTRDRWRCGLLG